MRIDPKVLMMDINKLGSGNSPAVDNRQSAVTDKNTAPSAENAAQRSASEAKVQVSGEARTMQTILEHLAELPPMDSAKVARVKSAVEEGRYEVSAQRIADKMLKLDGELREATSDQPQDDADNKDQRV